MSEEITPMGNFGQNPDDPSHHLVVENGNFWKKRELILTMKMAIIQKAILDKSLPCESSPKNIGQM